MKFITPPYGTIVGQPQISYLPPKPKKKTDDITHILTYVSDKSGCAHYRVIWPDYVLNSVYDDILISENRKINFYLPFLESTKVIRFQRQVSDTQLENYKKYRQICDKFGARLVYEIDDIPFYEDIPLYNKNRSSFANPKYRQNIEDMMKMSDEVTVTTSFMAEYFKEKVKTDNFTVIPNYMPKFWADRYFDEHTLKINFSKTKNKPRILYSGSASHYSIDGSIEDDFSELEEFVKKTYNKYQWIFMGGLPRRLYDLYRSGKIEFQNYVPIVNYNEVYKKLKPTLTIAPLQKNNFNRAKSNIKLIESGAFGVPCICQSGIETYNDGIYFFDTASELDDQIKSLTMDSQSYLKACRKSRAIAEKFWLEDNIKVWEKFYRYPIFSDKRS